MVGLPKYDRLFMPAMHVPRLGFEVKGRKRYVPPNPRKTLIITWQLWNLEGRRKFGILQY